MKSTFAGTNSSAIRSLTTIRPTRAGFAVSVPALLAIASLLPVAYGAPSMPVSVTPLTASLTASQTQQFTATVSGSSTTAVNWSVSPAVGTVSSTGLYAAPGSISSAQTITVRATSAADTSKSATATVTLKPPVAVSLTPATATLTPSQTQVLTAAVTNATNTAVTWSLSPAVGKISTNGATALYTAPSVVDSDQTVQITATSMADNTKFARTVISLLSAVTVSVAPAGGATLNEAQTQTFSATVTGASKPTVTWALDSPVGTISQSGVYTAPALLNDSQTVQVIAQSVVNPAKFGKAPITLRPARFTISVSPATVSLGVSQTQNFSAAVRGIANSGVTWSPSPAVGTISASGLYTAPSSIPVTQTIVITAASVANPAIFGTATVVLVSQGSVSVTPTTADLNYGQSQKFYASVTGMTNQDVTWSFDPPIGSMADDGTYTAPAGIAADQAVTVTATSAADQTKRGGGTVHLHADLQFSLSDKCLTSLSYRGQSYYTTSISNLVEGATFRTPGGTESDTGWLGTGGAVRTQGANYFQHVYNSGKSHQFTVKLVWSRPDHRTLKVDSYVTNNDPTDTLARINLFFLPVAVPGPIVGQLLHYSIVADQLAADPAGFISGTWGSLAVWQDYPTLAFIHATYNDPAQTFFNFVLSNYSSRTFGVSTSGVIKYYEAPITPGQTQHLTYYLRFGAATDKVATLAPEAFNSYRAAFPNLVNWPDRRPIGNWFISEGTKHSSLNPRGYMWDPTMDVSNHPSFRAAVLAQANQIIGRMNAMTPKPQGIIVWDLEGQEFVHSFTYVGYPSNLPVLAPEMDSVADEVFSTLRAAGYRVGVTVRPQQFGTGTTLPSTCVYSSNYNQSDKFIKLDAAPPYRGYVCTAPNTWTVASMSQPYAQTDTDDDSALLANLEKKIAYARSRWNATLFYIDSTVWVNGNSMYASIFRTLAQEFPDVLLIPEEQTDYHYGTSAPYDQANMGVYQTPTSAKNVYPGAFTVINVADANFTNPTVMQGLVNGVSGGDILLFRAFYGAPEIPIVQSIYAAAAALTH